MKINPIMQQPILRKINFRSWNVMDAAIDYAERGAYSSSLTQKDSFQKDDTNTKNSTQPKPQKGTYEWALTWNRDIRKQELDEEYKKAKKGMSWWKRTFTYALEDLEKANKETLERENIMVTTLLQNSTRFQEQLNEAATISKHNAETNAQIAADKERLAKWQSASEIAQAFRIKNQGGLDDRIAGYDAEKRIIRNAFVEQVAMEQAGLEANVPNSILLYGAIGTGKSTFAKAIADETGAELIERTIEPDEFVHEVRGLLKEARQRYINEGRRTILLINEVDKPLEDTKSNEINIAHMKSWLDNCAMLPNDNISNASATTFFFTTNHPLNITDEILYREEKLGTKIALEPASDDNIKAIIEFYINQYNKDGTILLGQNINYDRIIQMLNPDDTEGAFGNDKIKSIVKRAFDDFNRDLDDKKTFEEYLIERITKAKRNIKPERLQEYKEQLEELCED